MHFLYVCAIEAQNTPVQIHITNKTTAITKYVYGYLNRFFVEFVFIHFFYKSNGI